MTRRTRLVEQRPIFTLKIEGKPGAGGIHALRALLKILLRRYGFRAIDAREETNISNVGDALNQLRRDVAGSPALLTTKGMLIGKGRDDDHTAE
jgi:hypothetical protein